MAEIVTTFCFGPNDKRNIEPNIWLGVSVEDQKTADERIPWLLKTPAAVRFVSVEPMLSKVIMYEDWLYEFGRGFDKQDHHYHQLIDWIICGCESGPNARLMELDWARSLRDQCQEAGVPFFFKQAMIGGKLVKMPELDGKIYEEYPEV